MKLEELQGSLVMIAYNSRPTRNYTHKFDVRFSIQSSVNFPIVGGTTKKKWQGNILRRILSQGEKDNAEIVVDLPVPMKKLKGDENFCSFVILPISGGRVPVKKLNPILRL